MDKVTESILRSTIMDRDAAIAKLKKELAEASKPSPSEPQRLDPGTICLRGAHGGCPCLQDDCNICSAPTAYERARMEFNSIAALGVDDPMPGDPLLELQVKLHRWQQKNFGTPEIWQMGMGVIEESYELDEACEALDATEIFDAIGDIVIYGCQLLTLIRASFSRACSDAEVLCSSNSSFKVMGNFARTVLKGSQKIRGLQDRGVYRERLYNAIVEVFSLVDNVMENDQSIAACYGIGELAIQVAESEVLKRGKGHAAIPGGQI